jgi:hypothetical protein
VTRAPDDALRRRALEVLGPAGDEDAREALESGAVEIELAVSQWEGTSGTLVGHRVFLVMPAELVGRVAASMVTQDDLTIALSTAIAERPGEVLFDLRYEAGDARLPAAGGGPYR